MKCRHITLEDWEELERLNHLIYDTPVLKLLPMLITELKSLVSYSHSLTHFVRYEDGRMESFQYESQDIPKEHLRLYVEKFITMD